MIQPNILGTPEIESVPDGEGLLNEILKAGLVITVSIGSAAILGVATGLHALREKLHPLNDGAINSGSHNIPPAHLSYRDNTRGEM